MKFAERFFFATILSSLAGCSDGGGQGLGFFNAKPGGPPTNGTTIPVVTGKNVLPLTVNGSTCGNGTGAYFNKPCVVISLCDPSNVTSCVVIDNVLVDTGSVGLRLFTGAVQALPQVGNAPSGAAVLNTLTPIVSGAGKLAECIHYGDGTADWGPVVNAGFQLGGETGALAPIQLIDSTYGTVPAACGSPEVFSANIPFNGILGIGLDTEDCGVNCVTDPTIGKFYTCTASDCNTGATAALADQPANPVANLNADNNGIIMELPNVLAAGAPAIAGYLVLGIGTATNNIPPATLHTFTADPSSDHFTTTFDATDYSFSLIDSGSNAFYFNPPVSDNSRDCTCCITSKPGLFCNDATKNYSATMKAAGSSVTEAIGFSTVGLQILLDGPNLVFNNASGAGTFGSVQGFDWGLPFFLGRNVYVGFTGTNSTLGTGPYWAF